MDRARTTPLVLAVDDRANDLYLIRRGLNTAGYGAVDLVTASHGREAVRKLNDGLRPCLILLDLMMPVMDGHEFLSWRKDEAEISRIPVVVMTTSKAREDVQKAYSNGASAYMAKPIGLEDLVAAMKALGGFYFEQIILPNM